MAARTYNFKRLVGIKLSFWQDSYVCVVFISRLQDFGSEFRRLDDFHHNKGVEDQDNEVGHQVRQNQFAPDDINRGINGILSQRSGHHFRFVGFFIELGRYLKANHKKYIFSRVIDNDCFSISYARGIRTYCFLHCHH